MNILVNVVNQKLKIATNLKKLVSGTQNFIRFVFNLTDDWNGLTVFAQFTQNGVAYNQYLDEEKAVYLPSEIEAGTCTLMLYGSGNVTIATTNYLTLSIDENILISDAQSTEISLSLYNQLVNKVDSISAEINVFSYSSDLVQFGNFTDADGLASTEYIFKNQISSDDVFSYAYIAEIVFKDIDDSVIYTHMIDDWTNGSFSLPSNIAADCAKAIISTYSQLLYSGRVKFILPESEQEIIGFNDRLTKTVENISEVKNGGITTEKLADNSVTFPKTSFFEVNNDIVQLVNAVDTDGIATSETYTFSSPLSGGDTLVFNNITDIILFDEKGNQLSSLNVSGMNTLSISSEDTTEYMAIQFKANTADLFARTVSLMVPERLMPVSISDERLTKVLANTVNEVLQSYKHSKILWSGISLGGTLEFTVPKECFYNNGKNLTLAFVSSAVASTEEKWGRSPGDNTALASFSFLDFNDWANAAYPPFGYENYISYAYTASDAAFYGNTAAYLHMYVTKTNTTDYAICTVDENYYYSAGNGALRCIYAIVPDETEEA